MKVASLLVSPVSFYCFSPPESFWIQWEFLILSWRSWSWFLPNSNAWTHAHTSSGHNCIALSSPQYWV